MTETGTSDRPLHVVATGGHVDHGKSSLIVRLTGMDPDRLAEEKRRGLTIDLGFAWFTLPSGREIGFVDVPGHERFVRTMLAGVGPVRLVLFVVAADEGWKPQSEEHLQIVDVLGVDGGVVALTKRDLVDDGTLALARDEVRERLAGTALARVPIVACSSRTGEGIEELVRSLDDMLAGVPDPETDGRARLFVDRVFPVKGAGTVVTGTLTGGPLRVGDEAHLWPSGVRARIRGLQTHRHPIERARPISRVAVNLAGAERASIARGDVLGTPGEWRAVDRFDAVVTPVRGLGRSLTARGAYKLHAGAAERDATIRLLDATSIPEGRSGWARIRLSAPIVLDVFDRFVLRDAGRRETVAGGRVLDTAPPTRAGDADARLIARAAASRDELPAVVVRERGAVREGDVLVLTGVRPASVDGAERRAGWWISEVLLADAAGHVAAELSRFHEREPLAPGAELGAVQRWLSELTHRRTLPEEAGDALLDAIVGDARFAREGSSLRLAGHRPPLAAREPELDALVVAVGSAEPAPPTIRQLVASGHRRDVIDAAVRSGRLVRISPELVLTPAFVERAAAVVGGATGEGISVSTFRERLGTSRKYAVPLLEHFDQRGVTVRRGDLRFPRGG